MKQSTCVKIVEVYQTECGSVSQCNKTNSYILEYSGIATSFKASDFIDFVRRVNSINIEEMILSSSAVSEVKILMPPYCDRIFVLTLSDVLNLRSLLSGAKFTLHLNSVLYQSLQGLYHTV